MIGDFFKRRKILKSVSAADLIPVRKLEHLVSDEGLIILLMPRFKGILKTDANSRNPIRIRLDAFGSRTWELMDGKRDSSAISELLTSMFPGDFRSKEECLQRVSAFMARLYQERYITFQQLQ